MGYDLIPIKKSVEEITMGTLTWPLILQETGMGYVLGYGTAMKPCTYVYNQGNDGSPVSNDGFKVTSAEAKAMAMVARGFVSVQRYVNKEWEAIPESDVETYKNSSTGFGPTYRGTWHEDRLKQIERFAEFAEKSGGFKICSP